MIYLVALLCPALALLLKGKIFQAIICIPLQICLIGWIPAAIWAILVINDCKAQSRHEDLMRAAQGK